MVGIEGTVGSHLRKTLSDALRDQLLQQEMQQRIAEFDAEQQAARERLEVTKQDMAARREAEARQQRALDNRVGLEEMRLTRAAMDQDEQRAGLAAIADDPATPAPVRSLIPLLRSGAIHQIPAEALTPSPAKKYPVTVPGPDGRPMEKLVTEDEMTQGVTVYREPKTPPRADLTPGQKFQYTRQLRNDFLRETAAAREMNTQYQIMQSGLEAARKGDMAAGSQAVLVTFQKILDPTSVVRESEYARSAAGQSLLARMEGAVARIAQGGAGVPVHELEAFGTLAQQFLVNAQKSALDTRAQVDAIAGEFGLDRDLITRDVTPEAPQQPAPGSSAYQLYLERQRTKPPGGS
jgi:hypothetical protein